MFAKDHYHYSDDEFEQKFQSHRLNPGMFSHEAHLRLAYIHIQKYGREQAEENMCFQIKGYAEAYGANDKFNKTVTIASVKVMDHFMQKAVSDNFRDFVQEFPRLLADFKGVLSQHYGFNVFADKQAKKEYIAPDLMPF